MSAELWNPEWCIVGNLLPYPYGQGGPHAHFRSQKIFPAGAKLYACHRWLGAYRDGRHVVYRPTEPEYGEYLA